MTAGQSGAEPGGLCSAGSHGALWPFERGLSRHRRGAHRRRLTGDRDRAVRGPTPLPREATEGKRRHVRLPDVRGGLRHLPRDPWPGGTATRVARTIAAPTTWPWNGPDNVWRPVSSGSPSSTWHGSRQPLRYPPTGPDAGRWTLVFNGEIYNFEQLREELIRVHGAEFATDGDSEVVAAAYHYWGEAALDRFRGMFAFALWDDGHRDGARGAGPVRDQTAVLPADPARDCGCRARSRRCWGSRRRGPRHRRAVALPDDAVRARAVHPAPGHRAAAQRRAADPRRSATRRWSGATRPAHVPAANRPSRRRPSWRNCATRCGRACDAICGRTSRSARSCPAASTRRPSSRSPPRSIPACTPSPPASTPPGHTPRSRSPSESAQHLGVELVPTMVNRSR